MFAKTAILAAAIFVSASASPVLNNPAFASSQPEGNSNAIVASAEGNNNAVVASLARPESNSNAVVAWAEGNNNAVVSG